MVTISFILARLRLVRALLPLMTVRKIANLLLAIWYFLIRSEKSVRHPPILILSLTTECNYSCIMCLRSKEESSTKGALMDYGNPREMNFAALEAMLREHADHLCLVQLHGGEPMRYSRFLSLIQLLNSLRIPYNMVTNGSLIDDAVARELAGKYCFGISVSLDAATSETYAQVRRGGDLDNVLQGVRRITDLKARHGALRPVVSASMCVFTQNAHEMPALVRLCDEIGVRDLTLNEGWDYDTPEILEENLVQNNREQVGLILKEARSEAARLKVNLRLRFPSLSGVEIPDVPEQEGIVQPKNCLNLYASAWMLPDMRLMGCSNATKDFGSVVDNPFQEVWNGEEFGYVRARRSFKCREVPETCTGCIYSGGFFS